MTKKGEPAVNKVFCDLNKKNKGEKLPDENKVRCRLKMTVCKPINLQIMGRKWPAVTK